MSACDGGCGGCGCPHEPALRLTEAELAFLERLAVTPFLPVARRSSSETPVFLEDGEGALEASARTIRLLELKGLIDIDYHELLRGFDYAAYADYDLKGSLALTAEGIEVLELLDIQGVQE